MGHAQTRDAVPRGHETMHSTTLGWRMVNSRMPEQWTVPLGEGAEILADRYGISREDQDEFAVSSHSNAAKAWANGAYDEEIVQVDGAPLERDESIRADSSVTSLARLRPVPPGRDRDRRQRLALERRSRRTADDQETGLAVVGGIRSPAWCRERRAG